MAGPEGGDRDGDGAAGRAWVDWMRETASAKVGRGRWGAAEKGGAGKERGWGGDGSVLGARGLAERGSNGELAWLGGEWAGGAGRGGGGRGGVLACGAVGVAAVGPCLSTPVPASFPDSARAAAASGLPPPPRCFPPRPSPPCALLTGDATLPTPAPSASACLVPQAPTSTITTSSSSSPPSCAFS